MACHILKHDVLAIAITKCLLPHDNLSICHKNPHTVHQWAGSKCKISRDQIKTIMLPFFYEPALAHAITKDREYSLRSDNANVFFKRKSNSLPYKATLAMILCSRMLQPTRSRLAFSRSRGHLARLQSGPALSHHWRNSQISNTPQLWAQSQQEPRLLSLHHQRTSTQPLPQKEFLLVVCECVSV